MNNKEKQYVEKLKEMIEELSYSKQSQDEQYLKVLDSEISSLEKQIKEGGNKKILCIKRNQYETCINPHEIHYRGCTDKCKYYETVEEEEVTTNPIYLNGWEDGCEYERTTEKFDDNY